MSSTSESSLSEPYDKSLGEEFKQKILRSQYVLIDKIGVGTFSAVWLAINIKDYNLYAIKIQHTEHYYDGQKEAIFLEKIKKKGGCKNLPTLIEYFDVVNPIKRNYVNICIVMNLCIGSVYYMMSKAGFHDGFCVKIANKIMSDVINGVIFLNNMQYMHTDIKPENILIEGMNKIFVEFHTYVNVIKETKDINDAIQKMYKQLKLDKIPQKTVAYNESFKKFNSTKNELLQQYSSHMIIKFKNICNKYCDIEDNTLEPNYYKKHLNIPHDYDLLKCNYILSDFGTIKSFSKANDECIQTRYYRAPEVIVGCKWDYRVDIWSLGCVYFELLNNDLIFNPEPDDDDNYDENMHHLYWIHQLVDLDYTKLKKGKKYTRYYGENGLLYAGEIEKLEYKNILLENKKYEPNELEFIEMIFRNTLIDVNKRINLNELKNIFI